MENNNNNKNKKLLIIGASSDVGVDFIKRYHDKYDLIVGTYCSNPAAVDALSEETGGKVKPFHHSTIPPFHQLLNL